jgi:RNA polymerase sigma-70 factor (ECF subfamily)
MAGDQAAMVDLVERYRAQVFGLCYRMLNHRQDAEDTVQETFVRVLKSLRNWQQDRPFEPWLLAIAGNRCRTLLSARGRRPTMSPLVEHLADERPSDQAVDELTEEVWMVLRELREEYRQSFLLFHEQQLSYVEISAAMNCPIGTAKTWVHRARRDLVKGLRSRRVIEESTHAVRRI